MNTISYRFLFTLFYYTNQNFVYIFQKSILNMKFSKYQLVVHIIIVSICACECLKAFLFFYLRSFVYVCKLASDSWFALILNAFIWLPFFNPYICIHYMIRFLIKIKAFVYIWCWITLNHTVYLRGIWLKQALMASKQLNYSIGLFTDCKSCINHISYSNTVLKCAD